jgi:hypothetical protein
MREDGSYALPQRAHTAPQPPTQGTGGWRWGRSLSTHALSPQRDPAGGGREASQRFQARGALLYGGR